MITRQRLSPTTEILVLAERLDTPDLGDFASPQIATHHLICDLRQVRYISHAGFAWLVDQHMSLQRQGGSLRLVGPITSLGGYLGGDDLARLFHWYPDLPTALSDLPPPSLATAVHLGH